MAVRTGLLLCTHRFSIRLFFSSTFFFLRTYRIYHKGYSDEGQRSRYTRKMDEGHSAILGKIHEPSLSCVLYYGRIATDCSSVRCRKSQMDKPKKRVTMPRYNGVTNKAIICSLPPLPPPPSRPPLLSIVTEFEKPTNLVHPSRSITNLLSTLFRLQNIGTFVGQFPIFQATETPNIEMKHTLAWHA